MEIHVLSILAYEKKKGNPPNHDPDKQTYIARDTWMPSLENMYVHVYTYITVKDCGFCLELYIWDRLSKVDSDTVLTYRM